MKYHKMPVLLGILATVLLVIGGCLVSGTFVVVEKFSFTPSTSGFIGEAVDITGNEVWEDHADKLDEVEMIGFELYVTNVSSTEWKFWAEMDQYDAGCTLLPCADSSSTKFLIFDTLTIPAGNNSTSQKLVSYPQSLTHLKNVQRALDLVIDGQFNFYGYASTGPGGSWGCIDSIKVVVTLNASDS